VDAGLLAWCCGSRRRSPARPEFNLSVAMGLRYPSAGVRWAAAAVCTGAATAACYAGFSVGTWPWSSSGRARRPSPEARFVHTDRRVARVEQASFAERGVFYWRGSERLRAGASGCDARLALSILRSVDCAGCGRFFAWGGSAVRTTWT